jgi:hypothetical protein
MIGTNFAVSTFRPSGRTSGKQAKDRPTFFHLVPS